MQTIGYPPNILVFLLYIYVVMSTLFSELLKYVLHNYNSFSEASHPI